MDKKKNKNKPETNLKQTTIGSRKETKNNLCLWWAWERSLRSPSAEGGNS